MRENIRWRFADEIVCWWSVDNDLDVRAVEVVVWPAGQRGESEFVPEVGAVVC